MRLTACAFSAVLLSGCSWLGGLGGSSGGHYGFENGPQSAQNGAYSSSQRCQIPSQYHPVPRGCDPASVTIGTGGAHGFPQQPDFSGQNHQSGAYQHYGQQGGQFATQGYGSHAGSAAQQAHYRKPRPKLKKPRWRGSLSLGAEKSLSGSLLDYAKVTVPDPVAGYDPRDYNEGTSSGAPGPDAMVETILYTGNDRLENDLIGNSSTTLLWDRASKPNISFDDAHSTPARVAAGIEYIISPKATLFANAGYSHSEGEEGTVAVIEGTLYEQTSVDNYDSMGALTGSSVNTVFIPNETFASFSYDFTDMRRYDFEAGGRYYFDPIIKDQGFKTLTPFVGASAGMSHHNSVSYTVGQQQRFYGSAFNTPSVEEYYEVIGNGTGITGSTVDLYDSQWIASGQLNAGVEWQMTPKTALAFETGVRFEQARDYADGTKGDNNVAIPLTIRGSYNF